MLRSPQILAIVFFISGLLHLLVRFIWRPQSRELDDLDNVTALQGQMQQLFHLHDAEVDQSFIATLPIFVYKVIIGLKNPFDCAVCLCEFEAEDNNLAMLFTWLLSHSTCPLCRASFLPDFSGNNNVVPPLTSSVITTNSRLGCRGESEFGSTSVDLRGDLASSENLDPNIAGDGVEKAVTIKLGKYINMDGGYGEGSSTNNVDARRCFSMGSFAYVLDESSSLQVMIV
ncbi:hypothetical protein SESBI_29404 [Sesbania bispinosa]|nr:hypothetical protein SESBI_29404 [Sesbania bispinosa]